MNVLTNVEIKARCENHEVIREILRKEGADVRGTDHQIDTYFKVPNGRLKLREGNIENHLIFYDRKETKGLKESSILLYDSTPGSSLKEILVRSLGILAVVDKKREISFIDNVKFHLDQVEGLGQFVEIEAIESIAAQLPAGVEYLKHREWLLKVRSSIERDIEDEKWRLFHGRQ